MKYSVVMTETVNEKLFRHLIREDGQEDLCFAFYKISTGKTRTSGIINDILLPDFGDRNIHGNVSFNSEYFDKVTSFALANGYGICFIHSHPFPGWQGMSLDDIKAEKMLAPRVKAVTDLPLIGMTLGLDNYWSARFWIKKEPKVYSKKWCVSVRVVGESIKPYYNNKLLPKPSFGEEFKRTISSWGDSKQEDISRLKVRIIGMGSVGSIVAEALHRTGVYDVVYIDFDLVERKNLDRLLAAGESDIGKYKIEFQKERLEKTNLFSGLNITTVPYSIFEKEGLEHALDCDILFSCVDMPLPRYVLDCISFANLIPVIDGGIDTNPKEDLSNIDQARWKAHTIGPERVCLQCLGQYKPEDAALEQSGELENPNYIKGLPKDHFINRGENVFAFSVSLAAMEMQQFLSLILKPRGVYYGPKEMHFNSGNIDFDFINECKDNCVFSNNILGKGDEINHTLIMEHKKAEKSRNIYYSNSINKIAESRGLYHRLKKYLSLFLS